MKTYTISAWTKAATVVFCAMTVAIMGLSLMACGTYQPPGGGLYRVVGR